LGGLYQVKIIAANYERKIYPCYSFVPLVPAFLLPDDAISDFPSHFRVAYMHSW